MVAAVAVGTPNTGITYGAVELKAVYQKYRWIGLGLAIAIHGAIIGSYYITGLLQGDEPPTVMVHMMKYSDLGPPPSMTNANTPPPITAQAPTAKPSVGAPVPVPDAEVSAEQTLATQEQMSQAVAPIGDATGAGEVAVQQDIKIDRMGKYKMMVDLIDEFTLANVQRFSIAPLGDNDKALMAKVQG